MLKNKIEFYFYNYKNYTTNFIVKMDSGLDEKFRRIFLGEEIDRYRTIGYFGTLINEFHGDKNLFKDISLAYPGSGSGILNFRLDPDYCLENKIFQSYVISGSDIVIYSKNITMGIGYGGNWTGGLASKKRLLITVTHDFYIKFSIIEEKYYNSKITNPFPVYNPFTGEFNFGSSSGSLTKAVR